MKKITFEVPDSTTGLSLTAVWFGAKSQMIGTHMVETAEIKDGVVIIPDWGEGEADE